MVITSINNSGKAVSLSAPGQNATWDIEKETENLLFISEERDLPWQISYSSLIKQILVEYLLWTLGTLLGACRLQCLEKDMSGDTVINDPYESLGEVLEKGREGINIYVSNTYLSLLSQGMYMWKKNSVFTVKYRWIIQTIKILREIILSGINQKQFMTGIFEAGVIKLERLLQIGRKAFAGSPGVMRKIWYRTVPRRESVFLLFFACCSGVLIPLPVTSTILSRLVILTYVK